MDKKELVLTIAKDILINQSLKGIMDAELKKRFDAIVKIIADSYDSLNG